MEKGSNSAKKVSFWPQKRARILSKQVFEAQKSVGIVKKMCLKEGGKVQLKNSEQVTKN